jgi:hypothetical protein
MDKLECNYVAKQWEKWCGKTAWSKNLREFGRQGGKIIWYCGFPQSVSAIPLCFVLVMPSGEELGHSRLKDIKEAIRNLSG